MDLTRLALAALGAFVAYNILGALLFTSSFLKGEFEKYPAIYRPKDAIMKVMPAGMAAMFVAMLVLAVIYAMLYPHGAGLREGACFGALIGIFSVCTFVIHNHVNLNIGLRLTVLQGVAYFIEWLVVGIVIGLIYRPAALS